MVLISYNYIQLILLYQLIQLITSLLLSRIYIILSNLKMSQYDKDQMIEEGEIKQQDADQIEKHIIDQSDERRPPAKRDLVSLMKSNPIRLKYLKESLKFFTPLKKNIYLDRKRKTPKNDDFQECVCRTRVEGDRNPQYTNVSYNCGERCLNRMMSMECDDQICNCGDLCQNRKFQKHEYACVYPVPAGGKGWGLCAGEYIKRGDFIMQYIGEVFSINSQVGKMRVAQYSKSTCTYLMKTSKRQVIDPTYKGNLARFINHSCEPNCITQKWNVLGEICIGIFAIRDIQQNQQLTFNYQFDVYNTPLTKCLCGSKKCKGYLGLRPTEITSQQWNDRLEDMICGICHSTFQDDDVKLIICDQCNEGFHIYCLQPPLEQIPEQSFYCKQCMIKKEMEKQRVERERKQILRCKKLEELNNEKKKKQMQSQSQEDVLPFSQQYERMYQFIKMVEEKAAREMMKQEQYYDEGPQTTPKKTKKNSGIKQGTSSANRRKDQLYELNRKAIQKFQVYLQKNQGLLQRINNFGSKKEKQNKNQKKSMLLNKIQMHLILKSNYILFEKIGAQIYFDINNRSSTDFFLKSTQVSIIGNQQQIKMFQEIIEITNEIINELQIEMGITEAYIAIPALFVKRLIGPGHSGVNQIQKTNHVAVHYHRRFMNEECYSLQSQCKLLIKGSKDNILKAYEDISKRLSVLEVQRIYLNPYEIKTIVNNMTSLKKKPGMAEFRISRQPPFKEVNHPFYYIQQKNKEITIIGTKPQIQKTRKQILYFFEEPNRKQEYNFNISLYLAQLNHKSSLLSVKSSLQKQIPNIKMMIFDPTPPRKNMTLSFLGTRDHRQRAKDFLFKRLQLMNRQGKFSINLQHFQDQMNYQMTKYYFKYMQNALLTKDTAFMKSWDILNCYYYEDQPNYMWKSIRKQLMTDYQTLLYACFVLKQQIIAKIQNQNQVFRSSLQQVYELIRQNMNRILNIYNVNNTSGLKNYNSFINNQESRRIFKEMYPHVQFNKSDDPKTISMQREQAVEPQIKERQWSFFQKKVFKKYKNLLNMLEQQFTKSREREDDRRRDKWR